MWAQSYVGAPSGWESASLGARTSSSVTRSPQRCARLSAQCVPNSLSSFRALFFATDIVQVGLTPGICLLPVCCLYMAA